MVGFYINCEYTPRRIFDNKERNRRTQTIIVDEEMAKQSYIKMYNQLNENVI